MPVPRIATLLPRPLNNSRCSYACTAEDVSTYSSHPDHIEVSPVREMSTQLSLHMQAHTDLTLSAFIQALQSSVLPVCDELVTLNVNIDPVGKKLL